MSTTVSKRSLMWLKYFNFFMYGSWSLLGPFLPLYFDYAGFERIEIGILMSVGPMISVLANPFWGYWSDRLQNPRRVVIIMLAGNLALSQTYYHTAYFPLVLFLLMLFYFFQTALSPLSNSLTLQAIENTDQHFGTYRLWGSLGFALMILVTSPFIEWLGIQHLGLLYASFVLVTLLLAFGLPNPANRERKPNQTLRQMKELLGNRLFGAFLLLSVLISVPNSINSNFIGMHISDLGGSEVYVGWSWFLAAILEVPIFLLLDRFLKTTARAMFGLMTAVGLLFMLRWFLMSVSAAPWQIVLIQLLHGFTFGIMYYTGTQICNILVPPAVRASGMAIYGLCWAGVSGIISGTLGGWLFDQFGATVMYLVCLTMAAAGTLGFFAIWRYFRSGRAISGTGAAM